MTSENEGNDTLKKNIQTTIRNEIEKAKEKKLLEFRKLNNEILQLNASIEKYKSIIFQELETFYDDRIQSLESLLNGSLIFPKKTESLTNNPLDKILKKNQEKLRDELLEFLKRETKGSAEFQPSELNDKITIGSVLFPDREALDLSTTFCSNFNYSISQKIKYFPQESIKVYSSNKSVVGLVLNYVFREDSKKGYKVRGNEFWDLENQVKIMNLYTDPDYLIRLEDNEIFTNPITCNLANISDKLIANQSKEIFFKGEKVKFEFSKIYCFQECIFWTQYVNKQWKVYGPTLQDQNESFIVEMISKMDFEDFLKEIFLQNAIVLIESDVVFLINPTNFKVLQFYRPLFLENLIGYRRINKNKICFVFYRQDCLKTVFIERNT